jgi:autotransporter-associated beta strand protein
VILDRPSANITVTLSSGTHSIRKLYAREALNITGGSLTIGYTPVTDSTPISAQFSEAVSLSGGASLSVHTLQVDATRVFTLGAGTLTLNRVNLMPHSTTPAKILVAGDVVLNPLANAAAVIANGTGTGTTGSIDLGGAQRMFLVGNGAAATDLTISVPLTNGGLTKTGAGTLLLSGSSLYAGDTGVTQGVLRINSALLANSADVYLSAGGTLDLGFSGSPDVIDELYLDGLPQPVGIWGAVGSGAAFTSPLITGTGLLQVMTTSIPPIPADFDGDGDVDGADLAQWQADFGLNGNSDADEDGDSDGLDILAWQQQFTGGNPLVSSATAVPEPAAVVLLLLVLPCWLRIRS